MGEDTEKLEKKDPMRLWIERHLGKVILASLPVMMMALAAWILKIEGDLATIKDSKRENAAQWKALYENRVRTQTLEVDVQGYKLAFKILTGQGVVRLGESNVGDASEEAQMLPKPKKIDKSREHKVDDFKREQIQQTSALNLPLKGD